MKLLLRRLLLSPASRRGCSKFERYLIGALLSLCPFAGSAFSVGQVYGVQVPTGEVHQDITKRALEVVAIDTAEFGRLKFTPSTIFQVIDANVAVDKFQDNPEFHFDDNDLETASRYVFDLKITILRELNSSEAMTPARAAGIRVLIGRASHTIQDFYSHTDWVNYNNSPNTVLGSSVLYNHRGTSLSPNCSSPFTNVLATRELIGGYALTPLYLATAPIWECAHGLVSNGIHKDWANRDFHSPAVAQAIDATFHFVQRQIGEAVTNKRSLCVVMRSTGCGNSATTFAQLDYPNATSTQLWDISNLGVSVGTAVVGGKSLGFSYGNGHFAPLVAPLNAFEFVVTGFNEDPVPTFVGIWCAVACLNVVGGSGFTGSSAAGYNSFVIPGALQTNIRGISANGRYLAGDRGVLNPFGIYVNLGWIFDRFTNELALIGSENDSQVVVQGVNNHGQAVGSGTFAPSNSAEGFVYDIRTHAKVTVSVPGFQNRNVHPRAINEFGEIAGSLTLVGPTAKVFFGTERGYDVIEIPGTVGFIYGSNDSGLQFVGFYTDYSGRNHGFILSR